MQENKRQPIDYTTKELINNARNDYDAIEVLLSSPPSNQKIRKYIFDHFYKKKIEEKKDLATSLFSISNKNEQPEESELKKGLDACDWLENESLDLIVNSKMDKKAGRYFFFAFLCTCIFAFLVLSYPSPGGKQTVAKMLSAFTTAVLGVVTLNATLRKDVLSSLPDDQRESIRTSHHYLSKLITKNLVQALSIIVLLITALLLI